MKLVYFVFVAVLSFGLVSCGAASETDTAKAEETHDALAQEAGHDHGEDNVELNEAGGFGAVISTDNAMGINDMVAALSESDSVMCAVKGEVTSACQMAGCWMRMPYGESGEEMMVKFKDYGFFVPKDLQGEVVIAGKAKKEVISVAELQHYAEDAGKSAEEIAAITAPKTEVTFLADGVMPVEGE